MRPIRTRVRSVVIWPAWGQGLDRCGPVFPAGLGVQSGRPADRRESLVGLGSELYPAAVPGALGGWHGAVRLATLPG